MLSAAHFCPARVDPTLEPRRVFELLAIQLARRYQAFADALRAETDVTITLRGDASAGVAEPGSVVAAIDIGSINIAGVPGHRGRLCPAGGEAVVTVPQQP